MCLVDMTIWAIIPVKNLSNAKSSLSKALDPEQRQRLALAMLADVINVARQSSSVSGAAVVSPDEKIIDFARENGATGVAEPGLGLNGALKMAIEHVVDLGAKSVLIIPGDLPLLKSADIENIATMATAQRDVVISPSKANGTNALLLRPPDVINLRFGGESFPLHIKEAVQAGVKPRIYRSQTVATDIDELEDLIKIETLGPGTRTHDFLISLRQK